MSDSDKVLAYQQNCTALATANNDQCACILALAEQLDLMLTAQSSLADWECRLAKNWYNFVNLTIISWHNAHGAIVNDNTLANNPSVLLPMQDGAKAQCSDDRVSSLSMISLPWTLPT
jgi:hypothetical protein